MLPKAVHKPLKNFNMQQNEVTGESPNNQNEDILEIPEIFKNHSTSNYSVPSEFKGVFDVLEIDDKTDFLQLNYENNTDENTEALEITGNEIISIPIELKDVPILTIDISVRLDNVLRSLNIQTLGDLDQKSLSAIKQTKNCGRKTINELCDVIEQISGTLYLEEFTFTSEENKNIVIPKAFEKLPVKILALSIRLVNVLDKLNINTFSDLENFCIAEIKNTENCGRKTIDELIFLVNKFQDENWVGEIIEKSQNQIVIRIEKENISISPAIRDISTVYFTLSTRLSRSKL